MKTIIVFFCVTFFTNTLFSQSRSPNEAPVIHVPEFADAGIRSFYQTYADHLIKCVVAIRLKDEAKATALFRDPGQRLVAKEKTLVPELMKNKTEKSKYIQFATEAYPYLKEVQSSAYYKKLYGK